MDIQAREKVVDLAHETPFALGPLQVEPAHRRICRGERELILEPKVMRVLTALGRTPGTILSRDDLIQSCWDGRIVGDAAIDRAISLLRTALREMADEAVTLETIARVGYRIHSDDDPPAAEPQPDAVADHPRGRVRRWMLVALAVLVLTVGGAAAWLTLRPGQEPVSIAVMPFRSLTPGEELFAAGLGQEIATQLGVEPDLQVAGRSSTELFARGGSNPEAIRAALGVDYLLDGSVRREGTRVRIDVSLVDTRNGITEWSRSFDGELGDVLVMQRDIGRAVLAGLHREVVNTRPDQAALSTSGELYREYLTARALLRERSRPKTLQAKVLLEEITRLDPGFAPAWAERAKAESLQFMFDPAWSMAKQAEAERRGVAFASRAIKLAPELAQGFAARALVQHRNGPGAIADLTRAVELDPNDAEAWYWLSGALQQDMRYQDALEADRMVAKLDPFWVRAEPVASNLWDMGEHEEAQRIDRRIAEQAPDPAVREAAKARIAARQGDWSGFVLHNNEAMKLTTNHSQKLIWGIARNGKLARLGIPFKVVALPHPSIFAIIDSLAGKLPSLERIASSTDGERSFWDNPVQPYMFPRMLINAGREADVVHLYDAGFGSIEAMESAVGPIALIAFSPDLSVALRRVGRGAEADRLLTRAAGHLARAATLGRLPGSLAERAARVYSAQGQRERAIASLKRAVALGWPNNHYEDTGAWLLPPFDTEPAFAAIAQDPWVRQLDRRIQANLAKERKEALSIALFYPPLKP